MSYKDLLKFICAAECTSKGNPLKLGDISLWIDPVSKEVVMEPQPEQKHATDMTLDLAKLTAKHEDALIRRFGVTALNEHFGPGTVTIKKAGEA